MKTYLVIRVRVQKAGKVLQVLQVTTEIMADERFIQLKAIVTLKKVLLAHLV